MDNSFLQHYAKATTTTTLGFFWMAFWAFSLGYIISSMIQVFVTRRCMQETMGSKEAKGVLLGTFFRFISNSCSWVGADTVGIKFLLSALPSSVLWFCGVSQSSVRLSLPFDHPSGCFHQDFPAHRAVQRW